MSSFHIIPWYFLLLSVEKPAGRSLLPRLYLFYFFSAQHLIDRPAATLLILWEMVGGFSIKARRGMAKLK